MPETISCPNCQFSQEIDYNKFKDYNSLICPNCGANVNLPWANKKVKPFEVINDQNLKRNRFKQ